MPPSLASTQARVILDACPEVRKWALVERDPLERWSEGRIVLIGDACHPMLPYMAQGGGPRWRTRSSWRAASRARTSTAFPKRSAASSKIARTAPRGIQLGARKNTWMRTAPDMTWLYDYDAWTVPLD